MSGACATLVVNVHHHCVCHQNMFVADEWMGVAKSIEDCLQLQYVDVAPQEMRVQDARGMVRGYEGSPSEAVSVSRYNTFRSRQWEGEPLGEVGSGKPSVKAGMDDIRYWDGEVKESDFGQNSDRR